MAKLIDADVLIENIKKEKEGNDYMCRLCMDATNEIIDAMPTTTESEIRAKVIDEFAEKLKSKWIDAWDLNIFSAFKEFVDEIAEQLKGE